MSRKSRGFTLVEILIVVIILGILAAIVIPQFTSASSDARNNSLASTLQTLRGQIELFKIQHGDTPPGQAALITVLTGKTSTADTAATNAAGTFGPYVQQFPINPLNGWSAISTSTGANVGWIYVVTGTRYAVTATNTTGTSMMTY